MTSKEVLHFIYFKHSVLKMFSLYFQFCIIFSLIFCQLSLCYPRHFEGKFDQITSLPGLNIQLSYHHYSGYLDAANETYLYYWFFESQSQQPAKDPVVLFLNGGPGCSSLFGALLEAGPFNLQSNGILALNQFAWNSNANILFLESPAGVGFSYKSNVSTNYDYATDDDQTAQLNFNALKSFYKKFPHLVNNAFYIAGESYAGIYITTLSMHLVEHKFPVNFKGISIGNAMLDQRYALNSRLQFAHQHHLINDTIWRTLQKHCCQPNSESIRQCAFKDLTISTITALQPPECKMLYLATQMHIIDYPRNVYNYKQSCARRSSGYICTNEVDTALHRWLNRQDVQQALHIANSKHGTTQWNDCNSRIFKSYKQNVISVQKQVKHLLEKNIKVLIYYGELDLACSYISGQWFVDDLKLTPVTAEASPWFYDNQIAAHVQIFYENLAFVQIKNAGHETIIDKPALAKQMFEEFLSSVLYNVFNE